MKLPVRLKAEAKDVKNTLMALPFARAIDIRNVFSEVEESMTLTLIGNKKMKNFLAYFKRTWLSENRYNFKPEDYSVYGQPDRTNNHVESFHSRMFLAKPTIWAFLSK